MRTRKWNIVLSPPFWLLPDKSIKVSHHHMEDSWNVLLYLITQTKATIYSPLNSMKTQDGCKGCFYMIHFHNFGITIFQAILIQYCWTYTTNKFKFDEHHKFLCPQELTKPPNSKSENKRRRGSFKIRGIFFCQLHNSVERQVFHQEQKQRKTAADATRQLSSLAVPFPWKRINY